MSYQPKIYRRQGASALVVATGGAIVMAGGAILPSTETQAAHIPDVNAATIAWTTAEKGRVNSLLAALENVGILATS